jgi:hypothetical protein
MKIVVGFVGHEEFRAVGSAKNQGSSGAQTGDDNGVFAGDFALVEKTAYFAEVAGGGDGRLDGDGKAVEGGTARFGGLIKLAGLGADAVGVKIGKDVELGIEAGDLREISLGQFDNRDRATAELLKLVDGGGENDVVHG